MNHNDEHVDARMYMFASLYDGLCILVCIMFKLFNISIYPCSCSWGCLPICLVLIASPLPVGGSRTLHLYVLDIELHCLVIQAIDAQISMHCVVTIKSLQVSYRTLRI